MKKFPGEIARYGGSNGMKLHINDEQQEWLRKWYPVTENYRLAKAMGVGRDRVRIMAREYGLEKSAEGMTAINARRVKRATKTNERNGCYDRKRGRPCSEATIAGVKRRWEEEKAGLRENGILKLKRERPDDYATMIAKRAHERRESIRKEKLRIMYGLSRKTKLKTVVMTPYTPSQSHHRHNALKRGYFLDYDCSEGTPGRYVIYYDSHTQRSAKFEANCIKDGFTFVRDD